MKIRLISSDRSLYKLCREVLLGFGRAWDFGMVATYEQARGCDLFLWDLPGEMPFPERDSDGKERIILLIARRHVKLLQSKIELAGLNLVLKPVNRVLLRILLEDALTQYESRKVQGQAAEQLRLERDELLQRLLHANLKLQEYDQDRTHFLAQSVHDLRAPLTAVQGYCSLLLDSQLGHLDPDQMKILERMERSVRRISRLTAGMLQMSVGPLAGRRVAGLTGDIEACITQAVHEIRVVLESKNIELRLDVSPPTGKLLIDETHMEQVLVNLLDNACRLTPRKGTITIRAYTAFWDRREARMKEPEEFPNRRRSASRVTNAYRIEIRDSGPGIPLGDLVRIFEQYTTASAGEDWSRAGLGLAICQQIVNAHQGIVFAESTGEGATLTCMLPYMDKTSRLTIRKTPAAMVSTAADASPYPPGRGAITGAV